MLWNDNSENNVRICMSFEDKGFLVEKDPNFCDTFVPKGFVVGKMGGYVVFVDVAPSASNLALRIEIGDGLSTF